MNHPHPQRIAAKKRKPTEEEPDGSSYSTMVVQCCVFHLLIHSFIKEIIIED